MPLHSRNGLPLLPFRGRTGIATRFTRRCDCCCFCRSRPLRMSGEYACQAPLRNLKWEADGEQDILLRCGKAALKMYSGWLVSCFKLANSRHRQASFTGSRGRGCAFASSSSKVQPAVPAHPRHSLCTASRRRIPTRTCSDLFCSISSSHPGFAQENQRGCDCNRNRTLAVVGSSVRPARANGTSI